jgi:hypothetical protein
MGKVFSRGVPPPSGGGHQSPGGPRQGARSTPNTNFHDPVGERLRAYHEGFVRRAVSAALQVSSGSWLGLGVMLSNSTAEVTSLR